MATFISLFLRLQMTGLRKGMGDIRVSTDIEWGLRQRTEAKPRCTTTTASWDTHREGQGIFQMTTTGTTEERNVWSIKTDHDMRFTLMVWKASAHRPIPRGKTCSRQMVGRRNWGGKLCHHYPHHHATIPRPDQRTGKAKQDHEHSARQVVANDLTVVTANRHKQIRKKF